MSGPKFPRPDPAIEAERQQSAFVMGAPGAANAVINSPVAPPQIALAPENKKPPKNENKVVSTRKRQRMVKRSVFLPERLVESLEALGKKKLWDLSTTVRTMVLEGLAAVGHDFEAEPADAS